MTRIDRQAVSAHNEDDLLDDGRSRRFDTEDLFDFHDVIRFSLGADDALSEINITQIIKSEALEHTISSHDSPQTVAFDEQFVTTRLFVLLDDCASALLDALCGRPSTHLSQ